MSDQSARSGQELILTAKVKGTEPITVSWVQDKDHILRDGDNRIISYFKGMATLTVPSADPTTSGKYTCQLRNDSGQAECSFLVTILGLYSIGLNCSLGQEYLFIDYMIYTLSFIIYRTCCHCWFPWDFECEVRGQCSPWGLGIWLSRAQTQVVQGQPRAVSRHKV